MKHGLTYQETLDIVEKFMIDSGIRQFCTEICKGLCCMNCYEDNPKACHRQEGRRLPCSIHVCYGLKQHFFEKTMKLLNKVNWDVWGQYDNNSFDPYFDAPDKTFLKTVRFPISIKKDLRRINIRETKNTMNRLIKTGKTVYYDY